MFDILAALLSDVLKKIFDVSADRLSERTKKRPFAIELLHLYDELVDLEEASRSALVLFRSYHEGTVVPLRTKARSAMDALVGSVQRLDGRLRGVYSRLQIYSPHIASVTINFLFEKSHTLEVIDVLLAATPQMKMSGKYPTDYLVVPTQLPDPKLLHSIRDLRSWPDAQQKLAELNKNIDRSLRKRDVNFLDADEIVIMLEHGEATLRRMQAVRADLAEFIQRNVPLSEVLME